jgi:hypothetical protein
MQQQCNNNATTMQQQRNNNKAPTCVRAHATDEFFRKALGDLSHSGCIERTPKHKQR